MHLFRSNTPWLACLILSSVNCFAASIDVYFGTAEESGIHHGVFDTESGSFDSISKVADVKGAGFITIHPNNNFLYSTSAPNKWKSKGFVVAYEINRDKTLTKLNHQSSTGINPCHVSLDATGSTLLVANYNSNASVAAFLINRDGSLEAAKSTHTHKGSGEHPNRQKSPHPHSIFPGPNNRYAYAPDLGTDHVEIYALEAAKAQLTPAGSAKVPGGARGPRHMKFSQYGKFAYVLNEFTMEIAYYSVDLETGALNYIESTSTLEDRSNIERMSCSEIRVHPNGHFIYSANRDLLDKGRDSLSVFSKDPTTGKLSLIQNIPARVNVPRNFNITPCGKWLIAGGQKTNDLAIFNLDPTSGELSAHGEIIPFEGGPICIEFID